jgi:lipopolysaccharide export system permease protein
MLTPFCLSVLFFTFVFLMAKMIEITNWIVNYDIDIVDVLMMIIYTTPYFLVFVLPMSIMISVLLTFLQLSSDNEITALKCGGHSINGLLPPVILFCLFGFSVTIFVTVFGMPWGSQAMKELTLKVASSNVDIGLKERTFNDSFEDVMLYVNNIDIKDKSLIDVFIEDKRQKEMVTTVVAPRGKLFSIPDKHLFHLQLYNGTIHQMNREDRIANAINFDTYNLSLDLQDSLLAAKEKNKHRSEMSLSELKTYIDNYQTRDKGYYKAVMELHRKFSLPFACIALGLLAMPLGVQSKSAKRSFGLVLGLSFFFLYYLLLSAGTVFGKTGTIPPAVGMWFPNVIMGSTGLYFLYRTVRERPLQINNMFMSLERLIKGLVNRKRRS